MLFPTPVWKPGWTNVYRLCPIFSFLKMVLVYWHFFFSIRVFLHRHWRLTGQQGKGGGHLLFQSTTSTHSRTFRHLFTTLHVRWLSHIFNRIVCIYQAAIWWDLPPYRITSWLINDVTLSFCLFKWWFDSSFFFVTLHKNTQVCVPQSLHATVKYFTETVEFKKFLKIKLSHILLS